VKHLRLGVRLALFLHVSRGVLSEHRPLYLVMACVNYLRAEVFYHSLAKRFKKQDNQKRRDNDSDDDGEGGGDDDGEGGSSGGSSGGSLATDRTPPPFVEEPWRDVGFSLDALAFLLKPLPAPNALAAAAPRVLCPVEWLPETCWLHAQLLSTSGVDGFEDLAYDLGDSAPRFLEWFNHPSPESIRLPLEWRLLDNTPFKKLLVVKVLRPDRLPEALRKFCRAVMPDGKAMADADSSCSSLQVLDACFQDASPTRYMWLVAGAGGDVVGDLEALASTHGLVPGVSFHLVTGAGSMADAALRVRDARQRGHWVALADAQLAPWLHTHQALALFDGRGHDPSQATHPNFRLFFAAPPQDSPAPPSAILEQCIRVISDSPVGLRATLVRALCCFSKDAVMVSGASLLQRSLSAPLLSLLTRS
jgi:hypothetical protein